MESKFELKGLNCPNCAHKIVSRLEKSHGITNVDLRFELSKLILKFDEKEIKENEITTLLKKTVKAIEPKVKVIKLSKKEESSDSHDEDEKEDTKKEIIKVIISALLLIVAWRIDIQGVKIATLVLSYLIVGFDVIKASFESIKSGEIFDENFLMIVATLGAFMIGESFEAVFVMLFYSIGELANDIAVDDSKRSISKLMDLKVMSANLVKDGKIEKISPEELLVGDIICVNPGEKVPVDSVITEGSSELDTSSITGEYAPKYFTVGDKVIGGFINKNNVIYCKVDKEYKNSELSKILSLLENASSKKAKTEKFITKFAKIYTPIVVGFAALLIIVSIILTGSLKYKYVYKALSFLVVSCPCALVLSVPLSYFAAVGLASKRGLLVKGANVFDTISKLKIVAFDKTGTLTRGRFKVEKYETSNIEDLEFAKYICASESHSNHPLAIVIRDYFNSKLNNKDEEKVDGKIDEKADEKENLNKNKKEKETKYNNVTNYSLVDGKGVKLEYEGKKIVLGNYSLMQDENINVQKVSEFGTISYLAIDGEYKGYILANDEIKENAKEAIEHLKELKIEPIMLTGDNAGSCENVASKLNIERYYSELMPKDKANIVYGFTQEGKKNKEEKVKVNAKNKIAFVGDGVNDAPVLSLSDVGISMGGLGSDAAIEASDIIIMNDDINKISDLISISKTVQRIVKQNIIFAIFVKILVLVLLTLGISNMLTAVFADVGVTLLAVLNSVSMLKFKR